MLDNAQVLIRTAVEKYCALYAISPVFEISKLYDLHTDWTTKDYPFAEEYGCYAFFSDSDLLYIGKVSLADFGSRFYTYFGGDVLPRLLGWNPPPRFLQTIRVHNSWEAPSLEEYLIRQLNPPLNVLARRK